MKTSDIALAIFIAFFSVLVSYWIGGMILGDPNEKYEEINFAVPISDTVTQPDRLVFNPYAKNPTVEVIYGQCPAGQEWSEELFTCVDEEDEEEQNGEDQQNGEDKKNENGGGENPDAQ